MMRFDASPLAMASPLSPIPASSSLTLRVTECFYSIQGESTWAGEPCVFIRLTGCPLRCHWCDTEYSFSGGHEMSVPQLLDIVRNYGCRLVEITGGEPLHQPAVFGLITNLCDEECHVLIETSGAMDIISVDHRAHVILDVKCPGSGMVDQMYWPNLDQLASKDQVKFVLMDRADYEWAVRTMTQHRLTDTCPVLFSPVFGELNLRTLAEWILQDRLSVRLQIQLHKYIWDPDTRGV